jgi:multimeric flavodoxin WrbA
MVSVLGISASLRNARFGRGSEELCDDIRAIASPEAMLAYLDRQTKLRAEELFAASANGALPFRETYENLRRARRAQGLSNSEGALAAALWGAHEAGAAIAHCGLATYFPATGTRRRLDELREKILAADGIVLSGPVYFGDRGSLAQEFIEFLREDEACAAHIRGRVYGGVAVGAKRNGGQETTLIYQMIDLTNLNMLAVGNDTETTSQYGGTAVAGDVGTLAKDRYGVDTAIGTGRRVARVCQLLARARELPAPPTRVDVWLLQDDAEHRGRAAIERFAAAVAAVVPDVR